MSLEQLLLKSTPREEAGSKTTRKYGFQNDFSLYLLLRRHNTLDDYTFLFDFHEDLVVLNSSTNADKIRFYQVKSKDKGTWSIKDIIRSKKNTLSIISKLYNNKILFPDNVDKITFVTNADYNFKDLQGKDDPSFALSEIGAKNLSDADLKSCVDKIRLELNLTNTIEIDELIHFKVTKLNNSDSSTHCIGQLATFLNDINPQHKLNPNLAYKQLSSEIVRKTKNTVSENSVDDYLKLIELKGITKQQFNEFLVKAGLYRSYESEWDDITKELDKSQLTFFQKSKLKNAYREVCGKLISDKTNIYLQKISDEIKSKIAEKLDQQSSMHLYSVMQNIKEGIVFNKSFSEDFIEALILKNIYEKVNQ